MTLPLALALITASVPCEPFATVLGPGAADSAGMEALGWTLDGRLIAARGFHFFQVEVFAHSMRWVADARADRSSSLPALRNTLAGPPGVFFDRRQRRLLDETGVPLTEVDAALRADIVQWQRLEPHGYTIARVARGETGEWLVVAFPEHRSFTDYRVFFGRSPRLEEHPLQQIGMGLDGGSVSVTLALQGRLVRFSFSPTIIAKPRVDVYVGPTRVEEFAEVARDSLPSKVRVTCLEPLPHERWWPDGQAN